MRWLPDLANKNTRHQVKFAFQMNDNKKISYIWDIFILKKK